MIDLKRLYESMPSELQRRVSCHDLKQIVDNYSLHNSDKIERLRKATERLLAFMEWGLSPVERVNAIIEAKQALEETQP